MLYIDQLTDLLTKIDNTDNLELIADTLQRYFCLLVAAVKNALISKSVSLDDVKIVINDTLTCIIRIKEEQWIKEYQRKLEGIRDISSLFKEFLLKYCFIGYLNYVLLKDISKLADDKSIDSRFIEYEKSYVKLVSNASFKNLMSIFHQRPDLKPTAPIGLPKILFHLNEYWQDKTIFNWITKCFWGLSWFEWCLLDDLRKKCIVITYVVLPSVLSDALEYLKSSTVQQKFQEMGISFQLPEYSDKG